MLILALLLTVPSYSFAAGTAGVSRSVANNVSGGYDVTIRLNDTLPIVVGIVETLPDGCRLVSTTLPVDQYQVSRNKAMFVVINTTEFKYTVRGATPAEEATGKWIDMLSANEGVIGKAGTTTSSGGSSGKASSTPGFEAFLALLSMGLLVYIRRRCPK